MVAQLKLLNVATCTKHPKRTPKEAFQAVVGRKLILVIAENQTYELSWIYSAPEDSATRYKNQKWCRR